MAQHDGQLGWCRRDLVHQHYAGERRDDQEPAQVGKGPVVDNHTEADQGGRSGDVGDDVEIRAQPRRRGPRGGADKEGESGADQEAGGVCVGQIGQSGQGRAGQ